MINRYSKIKLLTIRNKKCLVFLYVKKNKTRKSGFHKETQKAF